MRTRFTVRRSRVPEQRRPHFDAFAGRVLSDPDARAAYVAAERRAARRRWVRRWFWVLLGLAVWTGIVVLWATTPDVCSIPAAQGSAHCS